MGSPLRLGTPSSDGSPKIIRAWYFPSGAPERISPLITVFTVNFPVESMLPIGRRYSSLSCFNSTALPVRMATSPSFICTLPTTGCVLGPLDPQPATNINKEHPQAASAPQPRDNLTIELLCPCSLRTC